MKGAGLSPTVKAGVTLVAVSGVFGFFVGLANLTIVWAGVLLVDHSQSTLFQDPFVLETYGLIWAAIGIVLFPLLYSATLHPANVVASAFQLALAAAIGQAVALVFFDYLAEVCHCRIAFLFVPGMVTAVAWALLYRRPRATFL